LKVIESVKELRAELNGKSDVGFVPTMGALHRGHKALIDRAREENRTVVLSIFVNPTQFLKGEDLSKYPRTFEADREIALRSGVDYIFFPNIDEIYGSSDEVQILAPKVGGYILEGSRRPDHFNGVLQVVLKLFNIVQPHRAYFGKKDAQQLSLIQQMVDNLFIPIDIVPIDIVRDSDGLALSSRNRYLSDSERLLAGTIPKGIEEASRLVIAGERDVKTLVRRVNEIYKDLDVEYIETVNSKFNSISEIEIGNSILLVAVKIGTTRLIDNIWF